MLINNYTLPQHYSNITPGANPTETTETGDSEKFAMFSVPLIRPTDKLVSRIKPNVIYHQQSIIKQ